MKDRGYLELFQDVTKAITSVLDYNDVFRLIVKKIPEVFKIDAATIRLLDPEGKKLTLVAAYGLSDKYLDRGPVDAGKSIQEVLTGEPVVVFDALSDPRIQYPVAARQEGIKSILAVPILIRGKVCGVLRLLSKQYRFFSDEEIGFATALAEQSGIAIENARIYHDLENQLNYFKTLDEIGKILNSTLEFKEVLNLIVTKLTQVMKLKGCTIRLVDPQKGHLELVASSGLSESYLSRGSIDEELSSLHALKGEAVVIQDAASDSRVSYQEEAKKEGVASILAVPIKVKNRIIGVLRLLTSEKRIFSKADVKFCMAVAEQGGIAIQNAINYDKINKLVLELEQNEDFLQNIMDRLNADIVVLDKDYRIIMTNKIFLENHGLKDQEISGMPYREVMKDMNENDIREISGLKTKVPTLNIKKILKEEKERYLEIMTSPVSIYSSEGEVDFIIKTIRDVTDHVQLQKEQKKRERMQGILEMAGTIAHEFNSPMFAALGTAQLLMEDIEPTHPMYDDIKTITSSLEEMARLSKKMTQLTSYESKRYYGDVNIIDLDKASQKKKTLIEK